MAHVLTWHGDSALRRRFLADRYVEGTCPLCKYEVTGEHGEHEHKHSQGPF